MYKTVLVPLDGSLRAEGVLRHVEELAHHFQACVVLLRVVDMGPPIGVAETGYAMLRRHELERRTREANSYLAGVQGILREKGIETRVLVVFGRPVEAIIKAAEQEGADLVAIASHGRSGLAQVFYGGVAAGVLQRIDRPLLLIRSR